MKNKWNKRLHTPFVQLLQGSMRNAIRSIAMHAYCPVTVVQRYRDGVCSLLFHLLTLGAHAQRGLL